MKDERKAAIAEEIVRRLKAYELEHGNVQRPYVEDVEALTNEAGVIAFVIDGDDVFMQVQEA